MKTSGNSNPVRVALYMRVSTDEQAKSGYSIPDQRRTLTDHAQREGWRVVEEIVDDGYSGASPDRPGVRHIYELAEAGEIDVVLATKRDRFFRSRLYMLTTNQDLKDYEVTLVSLTDTGSMIGDSVMDSFAEYEHQLIRDRTTSGKLQKARAGKVVGGHNRAYGFDWVRDGNGKAVAYAVNEAEMVTVRRIFSEVASGTGIRTVKERLDAERVPRPGWGKTWSRPFLRNMLLNDLYRPHTVEELRALGVSEEVAATLDADATHGVYGYEGIPVPVNLTGSGLDRATVDAARHRVENNAPTSRNGGRFWELSGGVLFCSECGRRMQTHTVNAEKGWLYYRCQTTTSGKADPCTMRTKVRADAIEPEVWNAVRGLVDDKELLLRRARESFDAKRAELSHFRMDAPKVARDLTKIEEARANFQRAFGVSAISLADLEARTAELNAERDALREQLERAGKRDEELGDLNRAQTALEERIRDGFDGLDSKTPEERREIYGDLNLRVDVGPDKVPRISGSFPVNWGGTTGTLWKMPNGNRAAFVTSESPGYESHTLYVKDSSGRMVGREITSSALGARSLRP